MSGPNANGLREQQQDPNMENQPPGPSSSIINTTPRQTPEPIEIQPGTKAWEKELTKIQTRLRMITSPTFLLQQLPYGSLDLQRILVDFATYTYEQHIEKLSMSCRIATGHIHNLLHTVVDKCTCPAGIVGYHRLLNNTSVRETCVRIIDEAVVSSDKVLNTLSTNTIDHRLREAVAVIVSYKLLWVVSHLYRHHIEQIMEKKQTAYLNTTARFLLTYMYFFHVTNDNNILIRSLGNFPQLLMNTPT